MSMFRHLSALLLVGSIGFAAACGSAPESTDEAQSASAELAACPATKPVQASACVANNGQSCTYSNDAGIPTTCSCYPNGRNTPEWHCVGRP